MAGSRRFKRISLMLIVAGAVTIAGYVAAWHFATRGKTPLFDWVQGLGKQDWSQSGLTVPQHALTHLDALGIAAVGRHWSWSVTRAWIGPLVMAAIVGAGF